MNSRPQTGTSVHINVSMVPLKLGDALSLLLPGAVVLYAVTPYLESDPTWAGIENGVIASFAMLIAAAVFGGVLEAFTRVTWERYILNKWCPSPNILPSLGKHPRRIDLYDRGVQGSYKFATFYANLAWAVLIVMLARGGQVGCPWLVLFILVAGLLLWTSYVQWTYFVNYLKQVFERNTEDAKK